MKKVLLIIAIVLFIGIISLIIFSLYIGKTFLKAEGLALYSSKGAWTRIAEYAHSLSKDNYIKQANEKLKFIDEGISSWNETVKSFGFSMTEYEKAQKDAYEQTNKNIQKGEDPLAYLDNGLNTQQAALPDPEPQSGQAK